MTVLMGPADADNYRVKVGRYGDRWYTDPLPTCPIAEASDWQGPSYSIVKKASGSDWSFVSLGRCADDLAARPQAYAGIDRDKIYGQFTTANKTGLNVAAGRGTIIHWWFEDGLAGRPLRTITDIDLAAARIPFESRTLALTYLAAIGAFFDTYQPELVVSEVVCIDRDLNGIGYGATGDAGLRIDSKLYATDWKSRGASSDHGCYPEEAAQVGGAFAGAQYVIVADADGNPVRAAMPAFDGGIVVSVKPDGCRIYPVDLALARTHYENMHSWWVARLDERKAYGRSWPAKKIKNPAPAATDRRAELLARYNAFNDTEQAAFRALNIDKDDLDAIEDGLNSVDSFNAETPPKPAEPPTPRLAPPAAPDEGGPVDDSDVEALKKRYDTLVPGAALWTGALVAQGNRGHSWRINEGQPTVRRYELYRGVLELAEWSDGGADDIVRAIVRQLTDVDAAEFPTTPPGLALGLLDAARAQRFAVIATEVAQNKFALVIYEDGMPSLSAVA